MFKVSKTFEVWTPESVEFGEAEERGFVFQDEKYSLQELLKEIDWSGFNELSQSHISYFKGQRDKNHAWISTTDANHDYKTSADTYYGLHIDCQQRHFYKICKLAGLVKEG